MGKKFIGSKPENGDKKGKGRSEADLVVMKKQRGQRNSKAGKDKRMTQKVWNTSIYRDPKP